MPFELARSFHHSASLPEISLGSVKLKVAPLTVRQIIGVSEMLPQLSEAQSTAASINLLIDFVLLGLSRTYPSLTREELLDCEATIAQLRAAADVVIVQAGGKRPDAQGEA